MVKSLAEYQKHHPWRVAVARRISEARRAERSENVYATERTLEDYEDALGGLGPRLLSHIRSFPHPTVVAIGEGKGYAVNEWRKDSRLSDIAIHPTGLLPYHDDPQYRRAGIRLTPAETLRVNVPDSSVSAAIAVYSTTYCRIQRLPNIRIDQLLAPGGVYKAVYPSSKAVVADQRHELLRNMHTFEETVEFFRKKGYDVATGVTPINREAPMIILAIKPDPSRTLPSAENMLGLDMADLVDERLQVRGLSGVLAGFLT